MENINIDEIIPIFNKYQQDISTEETKIMQLKVSLKHKGKDKY